MPNPMKQRDKIVRSLNELPALKSGKVKSTSLIFYYAYALAMRDVISELEMMGREMKDLLGEDSTVGGKSGFESDGF